MSTVIWQKEDLDTWIPGTLLCIKYNISRHTLERLAKRGAIEVQKGENPNTTSTLNKNINYYKIPSAKNIKTKKIGPTKPTVIHALANAEDPKDVTKDVEKAGSVQAYLDAVKSAKEKVYLTKKASAAEAAIKILSLSDIHFPFQNQELIDEIIDIHKDADILVLNGDLLDGYAASSFAKDKNIPMHLEYTMALEFVRKVASIFPQVYIVRGNHEHRLEKYFANKIDPTMQMFACKDTLYYLAKGYILDEDGTHIGTVELPNVVYNPQGNPWILQLNKTVFLHPSTYLSAPLGTVVKACDYLQNFLEWDSYDCVVMGHTHKLGKLVYKGKLVMEQGCLVQLMDYQRSAKFTKEAVTLGYAVVYQDEDGNTLFNETDVKYCGTLNYLK
jgi:predicted phosphodiesterase